MSDASATPNNHAPYDDEISIYDLLLKLWAKRGLIVILPLIFAGLTVIGLLIGKTSAQNEVSVYIELNGITLSAAARDSDGDSDSDSDKKITTRYPNGTFFSPQDLLNPTVIGGLAGKTGLDSKALTENIDVQFGTPISNGVLIEYKAALAANSKASSQDLAVINERYRAKLEAAAKRGLKVTIDYVALGISKEAGGEIVERLLQLWNKVYTEQFVTYLSPEIASLRWTETKFDLTSRIGLQEADIQLTNLKLGVDLISKDDRLKGMNTGQGPLAADLAGYIDDFRSIFFDPLFLGAFGSEDTLTRVYAQDLRFKLDELDREIDELNQRLKDISDFQTGAKGLRSGDNGREGPQLDGDALSTVVNLAEQAALSSYLQTSLDQRYELIKERAVLSTRLERIGVGNSKEQIGAEFTALAQARYERITAGYANILALAQSTLASQTPSYYSIITQPDTEGSLLSKRDLLFLALAIALGGMLAIIAALVWPEKQRGE